MSWLSSHFFLWTTFLQPIYSIVYIRIIEPLCNIYYILLIRNRAKSLVDPWVERHFFLSLVCVHRFWTSNLSHFENIYHKLRTHYESIQLFNGIQLLKSTFHKMNKSSTWKSIHSIVFFFYISFFCWVIQSKIRDPF